ncbi:MAG: hypothetical protein ACXVET_16290 [Nocardioidaceae bacterium]
MSTHTNDGPEGMSDVPVPSAPHDDATTPPSGLRIRDRVWSLRTVLAVAISAVALSGAGGAALAAVSNGSSSDRFGPGGFNPGRMQQFPQGRPWQGPGGQHVPGPPPTGAVPGQLPNGTTTDRSSGRKT